MESKITKQAREFCRYLQLKNLNESKEFEVFSGSMIAIANANKYNKDLLKEIWLDDNISGIDSFFILVDNGLYSLDSYASVLKKKSKWKEIEFCFIESKQTKSIDSGDILKSYHTILNILKKMMLKN